MKSLEEDIAKAESGARLSAAYDEEVYRRLLDGESAPLGADVSPLLRRIEVWEQARLVMICQETGEIQWHSRLWAAIEDAYRRRKAALLRDGEVMAAHCEIAHKWIALAGVAWLYARYRIPAARLPILPSRLAFSYLSQ